MLINELVTYFSIRKCCDQVCYRRVGVGLPKAFGGMPQAAKVLNVGLRAARSVGEIHLALSRISEARISALHFSLGLLLAISKQRLNAHLAPPSTGPPEHMIRTHSSNDFIVLRIGVLRSCDGYPVGETSASSCSACDLSKALQRPSHG